MERTDPELKNTKRRGYLSEREEEAEAPRSIEGCLGLVLNPLHARRAVLQYTDPD